MNTPIKSQVPNHEPQGLAWQALLALLATALFTHTPSAWGQPDNLALVPLATSTFDDPLVGADGWQGTNNLNGRETLTYYAAGGVSGGGIAVTENQGDSAFMYIAAPAKFLGDKRAGYNGVLRFSLKQSASGSWETGPDVRLKFGAMVLDHRLPKTPSGTWETFEVPLNENVGWLLSGAGRLANREEILTVLAQLDALWIRAEYSRANYDRADLYDVMLLAQPSGPTVPTVALRSYAGLTINGAVGSSYRIEYRAALGDGDAWQKLTDLVLPTSPYLFVDTGSPDSLVRFYRAVLND